MPTGYTCMIGKGESFEKFIWSCAHAFGANCEMRDEPSGTKIREYKVSPYYSDHLKESKEKLKQLLEMTPEEVEKKSCEANDLNLEYYKKRVKKNSDLLDSYQTMLTKVREWIPPTPEHEGLKKFMIEQIETSIQFDCHQFDKPTFITGREWHVKQIDEASRDIEYNTRQMQKEIEKVAERNAWNAALRENIGDEP